MTYTSMHTLTQKSRKLLTGRFSKIGSHIVCHATVVKQALTQSWNERMPLNKSATQALVDNLEPHSAYYFKVKAVCQKDDTSNPSEIESEQSYLITTLPACKPGKPEALRVTHNSIQICWDKPEHYHKEVDSYVVSYCTVRGNKETSWTQCESVSKLDFRLDKLSLCTNYKFKIFPLIKKGTIVVHTVQSEKSDPIETKASSPPSKLAVQSKTHDSISLKWIPPELGSENIRWYTVYYKLSKDSKSWTQYDDKYNQPLGTVKGLHPDTSYLFKVQPCCKLGIGSQSEISIPIKTNTTCKPGVPKVIRVTYDEITLRWKKPEHHNSSVQHYLVGYRGESSDPQNQNEWVTLPTKVTDPDVNISGLDRNTVYHIRVRPICKGTSVGTEHSISEAIQTKATSPPGEPKPHNITHNSIELKWTPPKIGREDIRYYTILYKSDNVGDSQKEFQTKDSEPHVVVDGLKYRTKYRFKVRPECGDGILGTESEISNTIETKATSPPSKPVVSWITHNSIVFSWNKPEYGSEYIKEYIIVSSLIDGQVCKEMKYKNDNLKNYSFTLTDLLPQTQYKVMIRPICTQGTIGSDSEESDPIRTKTTSAAGKPKAKEIYYDSIRLAWTPPDINPDKVQHYEVHYHCENDPTEEWKKQSTKGTQKTILIGELKAGEKYVFKVVPKCSEKMCDGYGEESEFSDKIETRVTSRPGKPTFSSKSHNSITIQWTKPDYSSQSIEEYCVYYRLASDRNDSGWERQTQSTSYSSGQDQAYMEMVIQNLEMKSYYTFKVQPLCESGIGAISEESNPFQTKAVCKPGKVTTSSQYHNSIKLKWEQPEYNRENILSYRIECYKTGISQNWTTCDSTRELSITVSDLEPNTRYYFKVEPECSGGIATEAAYSDHIETQDRPLAERMKEKCTHLIEEGPPCIYRVPIKSNLSKESNKIAKCHILLGKKPTVVVGEKVLMLVGATGSGKSTLINSIVNYLYKVQWDDKFRFKLITDEVKSPDTDPSTAQAVSQTSWITAYTFYPEHDSPMKYALTIIDTPGFGDTRGIDRDKKITSQIKDFFEMKPPNGIDQIHGIGFIVQAASPRLTKTQKYVFDSILAIFGKDIADNIFLICTFADNQPPQVLSAVKAANVPYCGHFKVNNSALFAKGDDTGFDQMFWGMNQMALTQFFNKFEQATPKSLQLTKEVLEEREKLEIHVTALQTQINIGLETYQTLQRDKEAITKHRQHINEGRHFQYNSETVSQEQVDLPKGKFVTHCRMCDFTCHFPCTISDNEKRYKCAAMKGNFFTRGPDATCESCPDKCHWTKHENVPYRFKTVRKIEKRDSDYLIEEYASEKREDDDDLAEIMLTNVEKKIEERTDKVLDLIRKTQRSLERLQKIALKPHPLNEVDYIDLLIQTEKQEGEQGYMERISALEAVKKQASVLSRTRNMKEEQIRKEMTLPRRKN